MTITKQCENCANLQEQLRILQFNHDTLLRMMYDEQVAVEPVDNVRMVGWITEANTGRTA